MRVKSERYISRLLRFLDGHGEVRGGLFDGMLPEENVLPFELSVRVALSATETTPVPKGTITHTH